MFTGIWLAKFEQYISNLKKSDFSIYLLQGGYLLDAFVCFDCVCDNSKLMNTSLQFFL